MTGSEQPFTVRDGAQSYTVAGACPEAAGRKYARGLYPDLKTLLRANEGQPGAFALSVPKPGSERGYYTRIIHVTEGAAE